MLINKRCKILRIHFFRLFHKSARLYRDLLLPSPSRSSFTPLSQAPLFETFGFFSPYSPFGSSRLIHGVRLVNEGDSSQIKRNSFSPNSWRVIFLHLSSKFDSFHFVRFTHQCYFTSLQEEVPLSVQQSSGSWISDMANSCPLHQRPPSK